MSEMIKREARRLLAEFKGQSYAFGVNCMCRAGALAAGLGKRAAVVTGGAGKPWGRQLRQALASSLKEAGVEMVGSPVDGAQPNAPREDVFRIADEIAQLHPDLIIAAGAGSVIDAVKAAAVLATLGRAEGNLEPYFGMGKVTAKLQESRRGLPPMLAVQLAASSAAHLTKYSNITDPATWQKKLIIDEAIVPAKALFDYSWTASMSPDFTADGALDGMSHCLEVYFGLKGAALDRVTPVAMAGIELIVSHVRRACQDGSDLDAREALGLGTDLGGYAIMIGGTNGAHLTSFSLVDILSHGRACALMNPYYTVFFAPAIEPQLRAVAAVLRRYGYLRGETDALHGRDLGVAVAEAMIGLSEAIGFPTRLKDVPGFGDAHIARCLAAAKNPQLESKLLNMPVPLSAATVEQYMGPILEAAKTGEFSLVQSMKV